MTQSHFTLREEAMTEFQGARESPPVEFRVETVVAEATIRIAVSGEIDLATAGELETRLDEAQARSPDTVVVDLRDVVFMDASGIRPLVRARERAGEDGSRLILIPSRFVAWILRIVDLEDAFQYAD